MLGSVSLGLSVFSPDGMPPSHSTLPHRLFHLADSAHSGAPHKTRWSPAEDRSLEVIVSQLGTGNWAKVAGSVPGRTGKQCRERWTNQLDPALSRDNWTSDEDAIVLGQQRRYGNQWTKIAQSLNGRSSNAVKNRWCALTKDRSRSVRDFNLPRAECPTSPAPEREPEAPRPRSPDNQPAPQEEPPASTKSPLVFPGFDWLDPALDPFAD
jgi:hypothetical protein